MKIKVIKKSDWKHTDTHIHKHTHLYKSIMAKNSDLWREFSSRAGAQSAVDEGDKGGRREKVKKIMKEWNYQRAGEKRVIVHVH